MNYFNWSADAFDNPSYEIKGNAVIDTVTKRSGTGAMKVTNDGLVQQDQGYKNVNGNAWPVELNGHYFHRWWMKMDPLTWSNANKTKANRWGPGSLLTGYLGINGVWPGEHNSGFISDQGEGSGGEGPVIPYDFNSATNPAVLEWQEYIVEFKVHSATDAADGWMNFYVNGSLIGGLTGVRWWSGTISAYEAWAPFMLTSYPQNIDGAFWIGDVSVDSEFNSVFSSTPVIGVIMATAQEVANAEKFVSGIKNLTSQLKNNSSNITTLTNYFEGRTAAQKTALLDILSARGYTPSEISALYTQLKNARDAINTELVNKNVDAIF